MAIDIAKFVEITVFKERIKKLINELRSLPTADGFDKVRVANDPEKEAYKNRLVKGIPLDREDLANFRKIAHKLKVMENKYPFLS